MAPLLKEEYLPKMQEETNERSLWRDLFAEFLGTFFLVFAQLVLLQNWQTDANTNPQALAVQVGLGMAFVVAAIGYALGDYGGAHLNPAVTIALIVRMEITILRGVLYWIAQLGAGILASLFVWGVTPSTQINSSKLGNNYLGTDVAWWQGLLIEMTITCMLCLTALATGNVKRKGNIIIPSVPVGLALGLGLLLALNSTGASMNPARSFGPCVVVSMMGVYQDCWTYHYIYWLGPIFGAVLAAALFYAFETVPPPEEKTVASSRVIVQQPYNWFSNIAQPAVEQQSVAVVTTPTAAVTEQPTTTTYYQVA